MRQAAFLRRRFSSARTRAAALIFALTFPAAAQFKQPTVVTTGNWPTAVAAPNLTGSSTALPNLCYADYAAPSVTFTPVHCLLNQAGGFAASSLHLSLVAPSANTYAIADVDGDGKPDFLNFCEVHPGSAPYSKLCVRFGDGAGGTTGNVPVSTFPTAAYNENWITLSTAKFTASGRTDVYAVDSANKTLVVALGDGTGFFTPSATLSLANDGVGPVLTGDFNRDGNTDLLVVNAASNIVTLYYGDGHGAFRPDFPFVLTGGIFSALVADINADSLPDLIVEGANGALSAFLGAATGFSRTATPLTGAQNGALGSGGHLIAVADLNHDAAPDILTSTPAGISVLLGRGGLSYSLLGIYNAGPGRSSYALADLNGDSRLDLAVDSPEGIAILYGNADGSFQTSSAYAAGLPAYSIVTGRFTGSGNLDAVIATGAPQLQFLAGNGSGSFTAVGSPSPAAASQTNATRTLWSNIISGDFDGDGKLDVALTQEGKLTLAEQTGNGLSIHFGNGDGTFSGPVTQAQTTASPHYGFSAAADFNGDGITDIANFDYGFTAAYTGGPATRSGSMARNMLFNDTSVDGTSTDLDAYDLIATGYLNPAHNGKQDVIVQDDSNFYAYQNNGDGTFLQVHAFSATSPAAFVSANSASGIFPSTGLFPGSLVFQDLDGDGYGDVIIPYHNLAANIANPSSATQNSIYIYWGQGNGNFTAPTILTPGRNFYQVAVADVDGDGKPDLILSDGYILSVQSGNGLARTFGAEKHFLAGMGINLVATADINRDGATDLVIANGGLVLSNPVANLGKLATPGEVNTGGVTVLLGGITPRVVTGTVTASPEPSQYGTDFTLTATITPPASGPAPTGVVIFYIDSVSVGAGAISSGVATYTITSPTYLRGAHTLSAAYSGDVNYASATLTGTHDISGLRSQTTFTVSTPTIFYGQVADGVGSVIAIDTAPNATVNGGTLTFFDGATNICVLPINGSPGTCPPSAGSGFNVGLHVLTAMYSGNQYYDPSTSGPGNVQVLPDDTTGNLASSLNPATQGQPVTFSAVFTALYATPTGPVAFYDGATLLGNGTLDATGLATFTTSSLAVGSHDITARYAATLNFNASATIVLRQVIVAASSATTTLLSSSANPSTFGQNVTFAAAVLTSPTGASIPTGSVAFTADGVSLGTFTLSALGTASVSISTLAIGSHAIIATYSGASGFNASTSATLTQIVATPAAPGTPGFTLTVSPSLIQVPIGSSVSVLVTVTEVNGFSQPVALSCNGFPAESTCVFGSSTIPAGGGTTRLTVHASAPHDCTNDTPYFVASGPTSALYALAATTLIFFIRRRRRTLKLLALLLVFGLLPALSGCATHCTDLGVRPGTYSFTVTGTSTGSPVLTASQTAQIVAHL